VGAVRRGGILELAHRRDHRAHTRVFDAWGHLVRYSLGNVVRD
jgi:hypothetical protein